MNSSPPGSKDRIISVTGLGYVGLPLAVSFAKKFSTIGFDLNSKRILSLKSGIDHTHEVDPVDLKNSRLTYTDDPSVLKKANFHIVAVPTPVDTAKQPDLGPLMKASETVGRILKKGDLIVFESTVYPGVTEEECLPVLEKHSGLRSPRDFKIGYSPERINPGDRKRTLGDVVKVVSGQDQEALEEIAQVYGAIVHAGIHKAESIKVAEAAKVIENTQRDLNIALMNELSLIFKIMGIDTRQVLAAAATKWNFVKFEPGLVGGHCIGVDPYYLTHKAEKLGYHPQVILAGRRINDGMGRYVGRMAIKEMIRAGHNVVGSRVTILGLTFKENCPDIRNTRVIDIILELKEYGVEVQVSDPLADASEVENEYQIELIPFEKLKSANAVIVAVAHQRYRELKLADIQNLFSRSPSVLLDVKGILPQEVTLAQDVRLWKM